VAKKLIIIAGVIAGAGVMLFALLFYVNIYVERAPSFENRKYTTILHTIEKGQDFRQVSFDLKQKDLVNSKFWAQTYFLLTGRWMDIKAGTYDLPYGSSTFQIAEIISRGLVKREKIKILEGWNLTDIAKYCEDKKLFTKEEFFEAVGDLPTSKESSTGSVASLAVFKKLIEDFNFLSVKNSTSTEASSSSVIFDLEGYLFPDTYEIEYPVTPEKFIRKALENFQRKITPDLQQRNFKETIIMASILEKEVRSYEDKQIVAGILWKRIKEGWPLQVDSTVNYALGKKGEKTYWSDLEVESLYNTYRNKGLPPGPICNPGLESIKAAVYYQDSPYWYYLSAKNGKTIFSKTFNQHVVAKAKYLR
jgi:UPF0755 protein